MTAAEPGPAGPPDPLDPTGQLRAAVRDCVHCGFCLPSCPTYQLSATEMESPRGRIHLIGQLLDGAVASTTAAAHLDSCLGCLACLTACPSGVRYDRLITAARSWASSPPAPPAPPALSGRPAPPAPPVPRPIPARTRRERLLREAIFATFPYPARLRLLALPLRAAQRTGLDRLAARPGPLRGLAPEAAAALQVAPRLTRRPAAGPARKASGKASGSVTKRPGRQATGRLPSLVPARGNRRAVVGMLTGCVQQVFFPEVNAATARVLAAEGCDVLIPPGQGCCGALSRHDGREAEAAGFARELIGVFERAGVDVVVVNSAGCGSVMKEYGELLAGDPAWAGRAAGFATKVADLSEFLADLGPAARRHPVELTAAYHDACHLAHGQRITGQPRELLRAIPGLRLAELADAGTCCGSAGIYNLVQPEAAAELGSRKAESVAATGAELLVSANPGCALQIAAALRTAGRPVPVAHVAQLLDASINGVPLPGLPG